MDAVKTIFYCSDLENSMGERDMGNVSLYMSEASFITIKERVKLCGWKNKLSDS